MKNDKDLDVGYFKLQAKNLFHDFKLDFMQDDSTYVCAPRFYDVNAVVTDFSISDYADFTLMKAQHILAKIAGFASWDDLLKSPAEKLAAGKDILDTSPYKMKRERVWRIALSGYEKIAEGKGGDYVLKCPRLAELEEIAQLEPNAAFQSCGDIETYTKDTEHFYVNVLPRQSQIRVLVPGKQWPADYAVTVRNIEPKKVYNLDLSGYEKIEDGAAGDYVLKCPRLAELEEIARLTPDAYFRSCGGDCVNEYSADTEHFYVNVLPRQSQIRVLVPGKQWPANYAVTVRNLGKM